MTRSTPPGKKKNSVFWLVFKHPHPPLRLVCSPAILRTSFPHTRFLPRSVMTAPGQGSTLQECEASCHASTMSPTATPTPPTPPSPPTPTMPPSNYTCDTSSYQCVVSTATNATSQSTCETNCIAPVYSCDNSTYTCKQVGAVFLLLLFCNDRESVGKSMVRLERAWSAFVVRGVPKPTDCPRVFLYLYVSALIFLFVFFFFLFFVFLFFLFCAHPRTRTRFRVAPRVAPPRPSASRCAT